MWRIYIIIIIALTSCIVSERPQVSMHLWSLIKVDTLYSPNQNISMLYVWRDINTQVDWYDYEDRMLYYIPGTYMPVPTKK